jgi:hypothetical protein
VLNEGRYTKTWRGAKDFFSSQKDNSWFDQSEDEG